MKTGIVSSAQMAQNNFWLTGSFHLSEADKFKRLFATKNFQELGEILKRPPFYGSRNSRIYVEDISKGIPYLSNSDMMSASPLDQCKYVSKKLTKNIQEDLLEKGWTLVSRVGTIGQVAYVRQDLTGSAGSDNILRLIPSNKILSGYLYAFLSSKIGIELQKQLASGGVQDYIDGNNLSKIPIPRLDPTQEEQIHQLIEQAAKLRNEAQYEITLLKSKLELEILKIPQGYHSKWPSEWSYSLGEVKLSTIDTRLDAFFHVGHAIEYMGFITSGPALFEVAEIQRPGMFKRNYIEKGGIPFLSGIDVYQIKPKPRLWISPTTNKIDELLITKNQTILVQADGQRYGILGRPVFLDQSFISSAVSDHLVRIIPHSPNLGGYIFIFLSTNAGRRELIRSSYGTSIPTIPTKAFQYLRVPGIYSNVGQEIGDRAISALEKRTQANQMEDLAQELLTENLGIENSN